MGTPWSVALGQLFLLYRYLRRCEHRWGSHSPTVLVIFLMQKLRPRLWAISRSSRKYHDFSQ